MYGVKIKHFDRERETTVIETQDEKAAALHNLCIATSHMLVSQCFTFTYIPIYSC